jgi:uncharacterized low-complexity protein
VKANVVLIKKCGEGKCGADKAAEKADEAKCGEGKCGAE